MPPTSSNKLITLSIVLLIAVLAAVWLKKFVIDSSLPPNTATSAKVDTPAPVETNNANQPTTSDDTPVPLDQSTDSTTMPVTSTPSDEEVDIDALIRKHLSVEMIQEINEKLRPTNKPPQVVQNAQGSYVDLSDRSSTVSIAVIDENGETIVFDITSPINLEPEPQAP